MSLNLINRDDNWKCLSITAPGGGVYYWFPPDPDRTEPAYDFYTGKHKE